MLKVAGAVIVYVLIDATTVEVLVGASTTDVTAGRRNFAVQKLCAGAYEDSPSNALYGWLEHADELAADALVAVARTVPVENFMFVRVR